MAYNWVNCTSKDGTLRVYEGSSAFYLEHVLTGAERTIGDGVDWMFTDTGRAMQPGTKAFAKAVKSWVSNPELLDAYFPMQENFLSKLIERNGGELAVYAWPGGYEVYYFCKDGGILCAGCVKENLELILAQHRLSEHERDSQWTIVGCDNLSNFDTCDCSLECDHCNKMIAEQADELDCEGCG